MHRRAAALAVGVLCLSMTPARAQEAAVASTAASTAARGVCGVADPSRLVARAAATPTPTTVASGVSVSALAVSGRTLTALEPGAGRLVRYSSSGTQLGTVALPKGSYAPSLAVDDVGGSYLLDGATRLVKVSLLGTVSWTKALSSPARAVFRVGSGSSLRIGVVGRDTASGPTYATDGRSTGSNRVQGLMSTSTSDGLVTTDGYRVRRYSSSGALQSAVGSDHFQNDPMPTGGPFHFYQLGAAVPLNGGMLVADAGQGLISLNAAGDLRGLVSASDIGGLTASSPLALVDDRLFFASGAKFDASQQRLSSLTLAQVGALLAKPKAPFPWLGVGAGLVTGRVGQYFPPGATPSVRFVFDRWYASRASHLSVSYTVRSADQAERDVAATSRRVALRTSSGSVLAIPLTLPSRAPGAYEVDARLRDGSTVVGATCLHFTIGAPGQTLDLPRLPTGADFGGSAADRSVMLSSELGNRAVRAGVDWATLIPNPALPMDFSHYDAVFKRASALAKSRGVAFWVQVGTGGDAQRQAVQNGTWGIRVRELAAHYKGIVTTWEAWNEPNLTCYCSASDYVTKILRPFSQAVRSVDPANRVIGGSAIGLDASWYQQMVDAGGLKDLDVVGLHPYTGHNRSWEEQGTVADIARIQSLVARAATSPKAFWITESAWWSDGGTSFWDQAHKVARAALWQRRLGIGRWAYFLPEGGYGDYGFTYSLVQSDGTTDNYVKPSALAMMTSHQQLDGRTYQGLVATGVPGAYAMQFGPKPGGTTDLLALWTDDLRAAARLTVPAVQATATEELGAVTTVTRRAGSYGLQLTPAVLYLQVPHGTAVRLSAPEAFGSDLLRASGTRATASSSSGTNPPSAAIDGTSDSSGASELGAMRAWASAPGSASSTLTVTLPTTRRINRIEVVTHSLGSVVPGLRAYDIDLLSSSGSVVAHRSVSRQFSDRRVLVVLPPTSARTIRLTVKAVNAGGLAGGRRPWFWANDAAGQHPQAVVDEIAAWGGAQSTSVTSGASLPAIVARQ